MSDEPRPAETFVFDDAAEARARVQLADHFRKLGYWNLEDAVEFNLSLVGANSRFAYLRSRLPPAFFGASSTALISGMAAGSELIAARQQGFGAVHGTEVDPFYIDLCRTRIGGNSGFFPILYDGGRLPYADGTFQLVVSGHIIEHTADPAAYLADHVRVLAPGGYMYLEFPTRFHYKELHTSLPSVEWLPGPLRNAILRAVGSARSPASEGVKQKANTILKTGLKQVSLGRVRRWLQASASGTMLHDERVAPGILRCLIRR
jgi:SAM-dependent methyltransferase